MSNFLFAFFLLRLPRERIFMCCLEKLNSRAMLPKYKSCSFCPKLPCENNNRQWSWREQKEKVKKKFHLEHRIEFYAALQFYTLKYSILLVHMWLAPSQWESPFVAPKLPRKFSLHCKIRFSFSITKADKNKWARFGRKNSNEELQ